jgi:hypothetical protein
VPGRTPERICHAQRHACLSRDPKEWLTHRIAASGTILASYYQRPINQY